MDRAVVEQQFVLDLALLQHQQKTVTGLSTLSRDDCAECGNTISDARRLALPGVTLCVTCKQVEELKEKVGL